MKGNHNKVEDHNYKKIKQAERAFRRNVTKLHELDALASQVNDWDCKYGHLAIGMPTVYEIEQQQREYLINAMYYNVTAKVKDPEIDAYLRYKVTVLATL